MSEEFSLHSSDVPIVSVILSTALCLSVLRFAGCGFHSLTVPLMAASAEVAELKSELRSIERLIEDL